jgi:hypothetical protein
MKLEEEKKPMIIHNKSSILLSRIHDSSHGSEDCSYCHGNRKTFVGL